MKRTRIDWNEVKDRLRASERAVEQALAVGPGRIEAVYSRRAIELARTTAARSLARGFPTLVFSLAQERYAIELQALAEVLPFRRCVPVPGSPAQFLGVINLRGEVRSVADGRRLLLPAAGPGGDSGFILMLRRPGQEIGLKVDRIDEFLELRREELAHSGQGTFAQGAFAQAVGGGAVMLLNVDAVLASALSRGSV
jgi:purine-binding chemotaxis protein CheW